LLDIGFGGGYLMELSKAYGFEAYGIEGSPSHVERLRPRFGNHVYQAMIGIDKIPWDSFDVVVMTHIVEHLADPSTVLKDIIKIMNPGGIIYLTVPDMDSAPFQIYGKSVEFVNPLVHFQYFNERSISCLLLNCGFSDPERIRKPLIPEEVAPRWMTLMRDRCGSDSGELDMIAKCPG
jgi:SAM-dependent methyltransferase